MKRRLDHFSELKENEFWDVRSMDQEELYRSFDVVNRRMNIIYQFVLRYNDYINTRHNYTSEETLTMLEAHTLTDICDYPDSTVTSLSENWGRTLSATSQTVKRLIDKKLVVRENDPENRRIFYLRPTEKGILVSDEHKRYDTEDTVKTVKRLLRELSFEEIETMFKGLEKYVELMNEDGKNK